MPEAIILGCNPKNSRKGTETALYVWEDGETKIYTVSQPHLFCTRRMTEDDAISRSIALSKHLKDKPSAAVRRVKSGDKQHVLQVIGPREIKDYLPDFFLKRSNVSEFLDWTYPPLAKVVVENGHIRGAGTATIDELLQLPVVAIDWELDKNCTPSYVRINTGSQASKDSDFVSNIFDEQGYNQEKLVDKMRRRIKGGDYPVICSHNIGFDLRQPREKTGSFKIGVDDSSPVIKGNTGFLKKMEVAGRQLFCSLAYAQNNLWCSNKKLETVAEFLGINYKKGLDYASLEELVYAAEKGDVGAREKVKKYCLEDAQAHLKIANRLLPVAFAEALAFETDLNSVCFNSKSTLARKLREKRYFHALHTFGPDRTLDLQNFDVYEEKARLIKDKLEVSPERGFFTEPLIVIFPAFFAQAFGRILANEPATRKLVDAIASSEQTIDRIILQRDLEALCEEPLYDFNSYTSTLDAKLKSVFYGRYKTDPSLLNAAIKSKLSDFAKLIETAKVKVVNYTNRFMFLRPKQDLEFSVNALKSSPLVEFYGLTNVALSGQGGRTLASINGVAVTSDLDIYGRRGLRTDYEREIYSYFLDFVSGKCSKASLFERLKGKFEDLAEGRVLKDDLVYHRNLGFEPWEYSWSAQKREDVKASHELGARKGEELVFGFGKYASGMYKKFKEEEFMDCAVNVDIPKYQEKFFGRKLDAGRSFVSGTISDIILSICPAVTSVQKRELCDFFEGKGDLKRWNVYEEHKQATLF